MEMKRPVRACLAILAGTMFQATCFGESADESVVECTHLADKTARLRCYDEHMARLGHKIGVETSAVAKPAPTPTRTAAPAPPPAPAASAQQREFGASPELLRKQRQAAGPATSESPPELTARVRSVSELAHGELRIELDNDQVWVETQHWASPKPLAAGDTVTIKHGTLGSFFLTRESGPALRVKRVH